MALTYTVFRDTANPSGAGGDITSTSRTYNSGELLTVNVSISDNASAGNLTIANSGTAQSWTNIVTTNTINNCKVAAWYCVMSVTQAMTITVSGDGAPVKSTTLDVIQHAGQHATTPVPVGKVFSGTSATDVSQSITPTSSGSCLWMLAGDWSQTNTFAAIANCTLDQTTDQAGEQTTTLIRPTTQPRTDANAFSIGETDTAGTIAWIAYEVQAAAGGGGSMIDDSANEWNPLEAQTNPLLVSVW
jgi:hypothetical protein